MNWSQSGNLDLTGTETTPSVCQCVVGEQEYSVRGYHSYHLHVLLCDEAKLVVEATHRESQLLIFPAQTFVFVQKRKELTLGLSQTLQLQEVKKIQNIKCLSV